MTEDFGPTNVLPAEELRHMSSLWYLHALIQIAAVTGLAACAARHFGERSAKKTLLALFALGCVTRFLPPALIEGGQMLAVTRGWSFFAESPTTHLATFCLGALFLVLGDRSRISWLLGAPYALLSAVIYGPLVGGAMMVCLLLFAVRKAPMFKFAARPIYVIADASLFIYLLNLKINSGLYMLDHRAGHSFVGAPLFKFIVAVIGGVCAAYVWNWLILKLRTARFSSSWGWSRSNLWVSQRR